MHKKRLLKLADLVEQSVEKSHGRKGFQFDMDHWGKVNLTKSDDAKLDCGTSACMMGIAAVSGSFKRAGLRYNVVPSSYQPTGWLKIYTTTEEHGGIASAMKVFGINEAEAAFLFLDETNTTGKRGARYHAKRVRKFVEHGGVF